jgi:hypothetical protein
MSVSPNCEYVPPSVLAVFSLHRAGNPHGETMKNKVRTPQRVKGLRQTPLPNRSGCEFIAAWNARKARQSFR